MGRRRAFAHTSGRGGGRWTNARHDPITNETGAEQRGRARLDALKAVGAIERHERATSYVLRGLRGRVIGKYTPDDHVYLRGGVLIVVEWKGRRSRDFGLRKLLFEDNYCNNHKEGNPDRLDVVPVLTFQEQRDTGLDAYALVDEYDPGDWPRAAAEFLRLKREGRSRRTAVTRAANSALRKRGQ